MGLPDLGHPLHTAVPLPELSARVEELVARQRQDAIQSVLTLPGNPDGIRMSTQPGALLFAFDKWKHNNELNHICLFQPSALSALDKFLAFYPDFPKYCLRVAEPCLNDKTRRQLEKLGWHLKKVETRTCGTPRIQPPELPTGIEVRPAVTPEDQDLYIELLLADSGVTRKPDAPPGGGPSWESLLAFHCGPTRRPFLAFLEGRPAGFAGLYIRSRLANLGPAATVPELRRRGIHTALLQFRLHAAYLQQCELAVCGVWDGNDKSLRNQMRQGLTPVYRRFEFVLDPAHP